MRYQSSLARSMGGRPRKVVSVQNKLDRFSSFLGKEQLRAYLVRSAHEPSFDSSIDVFGSIAEEIDITNLH